MEEEASSQHQTVSSFLQNLLFTQNPVNAINEGESCDIIPHHPDLPVSSLTPGQDRIQQASTIQSSPGCLMEVQNITLIPPLV